MKHKSLKLSGWILVIFFMMACSALGGGGTEETTPTDAPVPSEEGSVIPSEEPSIPDSGMCANAYYPVVEGATWSYYGTSTANDDFSFTNTITSTRSDGFTVTVDFDNLTLTQEWACTPDGILALDMGGGTAGTLRADNINLVMDTQNASGITYPKEILPGSTWTHTLDFTGTMDFSGETAEVSGDTAYNYTAIQVESVTVPAGTFDAMKVDIATTINIISNFQGTSVPVTFTSTSTSWYAEGVGWIKTVSMSDTFGIASTDTVELQSYNIP